MIPAGYEYNINTGSSLFDHDERDGWLVFDKGPRIPVDRIQLSELQRTTKGALLIMRIASLRRLVIVRDPQENNCWSTVGKSVPDCKGRGSRGIGMVDSYRHVLHLAAWCGVMPKWVSGVTVATVSSEEDVLRAATRLGSKVLYSESDSFDAWASKRMQPMIRMDDIEVRTDDAHLLDPKKSNRSYVLFKDEERMILSDDRFLESLLRAYKCQLTNAVFYQIWPFMPKEQWSDDDEIARRLAHARADQGIKEVLGKRRSCPDSLDFSRHSWISPDAPVGFLRAIAQVNREAIRREGAPDELGQLADEIEEIERLQVDLDKAATLWDMIAKESDIDVSWGAFGDGRNIDEVRKRGAQLGMQPYLDAVLDHGVPAKDLFGICHVDDESGDSGEGDVDVTGRE